MRVDKNGKEYVRFAQGLIAEGGDLPACGTSHSIHLAFDINTPGGQAIFCLVLAVKASNKKIFAIGTGTFDVYGVVGSWSWGFVHD